MDQQFLEVLLRLRLTVAILGEKDHFAWWQSAFFTQGNQAFLDPLFPRTRLLAQCNGVARAAALVHDERIGIGQTYHLFRLPEEMEQAIHRGLQDPALIATFPKVTTQEKLLTQLEQLASPGQTNAVGPVRVGSRQSLTNLDKWKQVVALYLQAFEQNQQTFPYFSGTL